MSINLAVENYRAIDIKAAQQVEAYEQASRAQNDTELLKNTVMELSAVLGRGQVCLPLNAKVANQLAAYQVVFQAEQQDMFNTYNNQPLVLVQNKLYFARYYFYEQQVLTQIRHRLSHTNGIEPQQLQPILAQLFPPRTEDEIDWQKVAAASACLQNFNIITGGPGTGKTTTVTKLLSALLELNPKLTIALAAPTGKAAARMVESVRNSKLALADLLFQAQAIPEKSHTLHRLLGWSPRGFRYHSEQHLPYDCVVVDEASMIDLPMMSHLLNALAPQSKLILLGDKDQLASVEVGSVLADLCDAGEQHGPTAAFAKTLQQATGFDLSSVVEQGSALLQNSVAQLRKSYRFDEHSGIGNLARAVNNGDQERAEQIFAQHTDELQRIELSFDQEPLPQFAPWQALINQGFAPFIQALKNFQQQTSSAQEVFAAFNQFQILVALRKGRYGVEMINQYISAQLRPKLPNHEANQGQWYIGRAIMVSENHHDLKLFNGDIGIALPHNGKLRVAFESSEGEVRWLLPSRLPAHETAFAMTVHKSQGSEFSHVALVLPTQHQPVITRELIYTAITRAKHQFTLLSHPKCWQQGLATRVERASGLRDELW